LYTTQCAPESVHILFKKRAREHAEKISGTYSITMLNGRHHALPKPMAITLEQYLRHFLLKTHTIAILYINVDTYVFGTSGV